MTVKYIIECISLPGLSYFAFCNVLHNIWECPGHIFDPTYRVYRFYDTAG